MERPDIDAIEARCADATPGPLAIDGMGNPARVVDVQRGRKHIRTERQYWSLLQLCDPDPYEDWCGGPDMTGTPEFVRRGDAVLMAHAREDIEQLIAYVRLLEAQRAELLLAARYGSLVRAYEPDPPGAGQRFPAHVAADLHRRIDAGEFGEVA